MSFKAIYPKEHLKSFLAKGSRPDGRSPLDVRPLVLGVDPLEGSGGVWASAVVRLGRTTVCCGLGLEVALPKPNAPQRGSFSVAVHLPPGCSPRFSSGHVPPEAVRLAQFLQSVVLSSQLLDLDTLAIREGQSVWAISADLFCLDFDGNLADACVAALSLALPRLRFPATALDPKTSSTVVIRPAAVSSGSSPSSFQDKAGKQAVAQRELEQRLLRALPPAAGFREGLALRTNHQLVSLSFGVLEGNLIVDPSAEEEGLLDEDSRLTVVYTPEGMLAGMHKSGGTRFSQEQLRTCVRVARRHALLEAGPQLKQALTAAAGGQA